VRPNNIENNFVTKYRLS